MRTRRIFVMAALAATALFAASCQNESGDGPAPEGTEAKMGLTISFPKSGGTRAVNNNATAQDMIVDSIDVFIFNPNGTAAAGNNVANIGHFSVNASKDTWTMNSGDLITTTAGSKKIYVGINLPAGLKDATNEAMLIAAFNGVDELYSNTDENKGVAMLSKATTRDIVPLSTGSNMVSIAVTRMPAKVTATMAQTFNSTPTAVTDPKFTVVPDQFTVGNTPLSIYPVQRVNGSTLVTPGNVAAAKPVTILDLSKNPQVEINAYGTAHNAKNGRYVPEHAVSNLTLRGESTYAVIRGELKPEFYSKVVADTIRENIPAPTTFANPVWALSYAGKVYFTESTADRDAIANNLMLPNNGAGYYQEYKPENEKLYTFYFVFIAKERTADPLAVYRNNIYDVVVSSVKGIGLPGDPIQPSDPEEPVFDYPANLEVEVVIEDWTYNSTDTPLE